MHLGDGALRLNVSWVFSSIPRLAAIAKDLWGRLATPRTGG